MLYAAPSAHNMEDEHHILCACKCTYIHIYIHIK